MELKDVSDDINKDAESDKLRLLGQYSPLYVDFLRYSEIVEVNWELEEEDFSNYNWYIKVKYKDELYTFTFTEDEGINQDKELLSEEEIVEYELLLGEYGIVNGDGVK